ncbi:hypothetical protein MM326_18380 [Alkalihalobacillus sp. LMS6]|uniref:DUF6612 family protein n=1 Tax=Alkalihalobacillus sp. LMS6 TaxID=2924034 RepID=UPI0020D1E5F3|nr:DUF6612 family protein [Alkalihalobacillus sp. LMS6]UTR06021.1 hypothetical protein MM326_18380 [Alkalihalobacillus sp. LMS6]
MKKLTSVTVASFFVVAVTGNALANEESAADIIHQSNEAMLELDSYSSETMMDMTMPDPMSGEEVTLSVHTMEDVIMDPFAMHQVSTISTPDGDMESTLYWTEDGMYEQGPDGEWYVFEGMSSDEMMELLQATSTREQADMLGEDMSVSDEGDAYVLTYEGNGEDLNDMINDLLGELMMEEEMQGGEALLESFEISDLNYEMTIEKDTYYMTDMMMDMTMMIDDGEESLEMHIAMEQTVSNFNGVDSIVVPDEVKENAEPIDAGGAMPDTASNHLLYAMGGLTLAAGGFGLSALYRRRVRTT